MFKKPSKKSSFLYAYFRASLILIYSSWEFIDDFVGKVISWIFWGYNWFFLIVFRSEVIHILLRVFKWAKQYHFGKSKTVSFVHIFKTKDGRRLKFWGLMYFGVLTWMAIWKCLFFVLRACFEPICIMK